MPSKPKKPRKLGPRKMDRFDRRANRICIAKSEVRGSDDHLLCPHCEMMAREFREVHDNALEAAIRAVFKGNVTIADVMRIQALRVPRGR